MKLKHFLEEIDSLIHAGLLNDYSEVGGIGHIEANAMDLIFDIPLWDKEIKELEEERDNKKYEVEDLKNQTEELKRDYKIMEGKLKEYLEELDKFKINKGESVKDLLERIKWQEEEILKYKKGNNQFFEQYKQDQETIKKLRARKNKVEVKRSLTTGRLEVNFDNTEYELVEKEK